jgi:hypothetical protein
MSRARSGEKTRKATWIRKVLALGLEVEIVAIESVDLAFWQEREIYWISAIPNLTNATAGGEGLMSPTEETRSKMRAARARQVVSDETRAKHRSRMVGNKICAGRRQTREHVEKSLKGRIAFVGRYERSAEQRATHSASQKGNRHRVGKVASDATRDRLRQAKTGRLRGPMGESTKRKIAAGNLGKKRSEETIEKMRAASIAAHQRRKTLSSGGAVS